MDPSITFGNTSINHQPHKYRHPCPIDGCDRLFTCPHNVRQHVAEKHTEERKNKCWLCKAAFARPWGLNRHLDMVHDIQVGPGRGKTTRNRGGKKAAPARRRRRGNVEEWGQGSTAVDEELTPESIAIADDDFGNPANYGFKEDNFAYRGLKCTLCRAAFDDDEDLQGHMYLSHNKPYHTSCNCMVCDARFHLGTRNLPLEAVRNDRVRLPGIQDVPQLQRVPTSHAQPPYYVNDPSVNPSWGADMGGNEQHTTHDNFNFPANDLFATTNEKSDQSYLDSTNGVPSQQWLDLTNYPNTEGDEFMYLDNGVTEWLQDADMISDWLEDAGALFDVGGDANMDEADDIMRNL